MKTKNLVSAVLLGAFVLAIVAIPVSHAALSSDTITLPSAPISGSPLSGSVISTLIHQIANWLVGIALVIALIMIVWGGIMWMWSRGEDTKATDARKIILNGILGAAVILALGLIFSTIQKIVSNPTQFLP
jgi:hypothetical protein